MRENTRNRNLLMLVGAFALAFAAGACSPATTLETGWTAPRSQIQPMTKVVTVVVADSIALRRAGEDRLARELGARGVRATPGWALVTAEEAHALEDTAHLPPGLREKLSSMGYDGVVTMRIIDREQNLYYTPSTYYGGWGYPGYWGYWGSGYYPGYAYTEMTYRTETNAYSLRTNQLVWSGIVRSIDPSDARQLLNDTSNVVATQLTQGGLAG